MFRSQLHALSIRPDPIVVFVSNKDSVLKLSEYIRGGHPRVGEGLNIEFLKNNGVVVIDLSRLDVGEGSKHAAFASSPSLIQALRRVNAAQYSLSSADRFSSRIRPLATLRKLTTGIVHLPNNLIKKPEGN